MEQKILKLLKEMKERLKREYNKKEVLDDYDYGLLTGKYLNMLDVYGKISELVENNKCKEDNIKTKG